MIYLQKIWGLCVLIGCLGWVSSVSAEDSTDRQNRTASAATPASAPVKTNAAVSSKDAACTKCHDENEVKPILSIYQTKHGVKADTRTPACQSCHGESEKHLRGDANQKARPGPDVLFGIKKSTSGSYAPSDAAVQNDACLSCHRGEARMYWEGSAHQSRDVACVSCHEIHTAHNKARERDTQTEICFSCHKEQRAQSYRASTHLLQSGKVVCSNCHNPHGSSGPKLLQKNTVVETCYTCHAEKRGPFLWEHAPVSDNCMNCHTPHGSNHASLLKTKQPYLCQQCHDFTRHPGTAYSGRDLPTTAGGVAPAQQQLLRACLNCHTQVHGTNHPSGPRFTR